jgi:hypothetical protein
MGLQSGKSSNFGNFGTPNFEIPRKWHLGVTPVASHKKYYKGGRRWLPPNSGRGDSCEFVYACGSSMHQKCFSYASINLLFGLCKSIWIIDPLVTCPNPHPRALAHLFYPWNVMNQGAYPNFFWCFHLGLAFEFFKEFWGASNYVGCMHSFFCCYHSAYKQMAHMLLCQLRGESEFPSHNNFVKKWKSCYILLQQPTIQRVQKIETIPTLKSTNSLKTL